MSFILRAERRKPICRTCDDTGTTVGADGKPGWCPDCRRRTGRAGHELALTLLVSPLVWALATLAADLAGVGP